MRDRLPVQAKMLWLVIMLPAQRMILSGTLITDDDPLADGI
jgi:hypothetical protein